MSQAGKGSNPRRVDVARYCANHDMIFSKMCCRCNRPFAIDSVRIFQKDGRVCINCYEGEKNEG